MIYEPKISLVIVSRDRPAGLRRLISALRFQTYQNFEIIVVTNLKEPFAAQIKWIAFDKANISSARNLGIQASGGSLVAFCDDDAVPEPTWLENLVEPFHDPDVGVSGGYVRGRNGIGFQWKAQKVDQFGFDRLLVLNDDTKNQTFVAKDGWCPKVQGTNCMFRKTLLQKLGGFDERFAFYLDETDVCWRASQNGWATAIVPTAEVQHGFKESDRRTGNRVPKSLFAEGYSKAYFCKKHGIVVDYSKIFKTFRDAQRKRLLKLMIAGRLIPSDVKKLLESLDTGFMEGQKINVQASGKLIENDSCGFEPYQATVCVGKIFAGSLFSRSALIKAAIEASQNGAAATVFCWSLTLLFHRRYFDERGFWVQTGGLFGKSERNGRYFQLISLKNRCVKEADKLKNLRKIKEITLFRFKKGKTVVK